MRSALVADGVRAQRAATLAMLSGVEAALWDEPGPGGRSVADLVRHFLAVDAALAAGRLRAVTRIPPEPGPLMGVSPSAGARWGEMRAEELLDELTRAGARLARRVGTLPPPAARMPAAGPVGRTTVGAVLGWRVLDEWVRVGDIVATAPSSPDAVPFAVDEGTRAGVVVDEVRGRVLADVVLDTFPRRVLPRVHRADGVLRLAVDLAAAVSEDAEGGDAGLASAPRRTWGIDVPRRQYGVRVTATPDAVIRITAPALVLVAAGRVAWRGLAPSALRVDGDGDLAADVLDGIAPVSTEQPG